MGAGWFLNKVIVDDVEKGKVSEFLADRWLAEDEGKRTIASIDDMKQVTESKRKDSFTFMANWSRYIKRVDLK